MNDHNLKITKYNFGRWILECKCEWSLQFNANFDSPEKNEKEIIELYTKHFPNFKEYIDELGSEIYSILNKKYVDDVWNTKLVRKIIKKNFTWSQQLLLNQLKVKELEELWLQYKPQ